MLSDTLSETQQTQLASTASTLCSLKIDRTHAYMLFFKDKSIPALYRMIKIVSDTLSDLVKYQQIPDMLTRN